MKYVTSENFLKKKKAATREQKMRMKHVIIQTCNQKKKKSESEKQRAERAKNYIQANICPDENPNKILPTNINTAHI